MWTLLIESSSERAIVALFQDDVCRYFSCLPVGYESSRFLIPKIEEGFKELNIQPQNIDLIAVGIGPGSYTGTRVGVVIAKSMAYALKKPLVGINSLAGFTPDRDGPYAAFIDAKLSGAILQKGNRSGDTVVMEGKPELIAWDQVATYLKDIPLLVTPNATRVRSLLSGSWEWEETAPDAAAMIKIAQKKLSESDFKVEITYLK